MIEDLVEHLPALLAACQFIELWGAYADMRVTATDGVGNAAGVESVFYLHGDHLGSTSLVTDGGALVSRVLYYPYG